MQQTNRNFDTFANVSIDIKAFLGVQSMALVQRSLNRAVNDLCLYSFGETTFKSVIIQVSSSLVAQLPDDCVRVTKLGVWGNNGKTLRILDRKKSINTAENYNRQIAERTTSISVCPSCCPTTEVTPLVLPLAADQNNAVLWCDACTFFGYGQRQLYGHRTNYNGGWIDDRDNNRVILEDVKADTILVAEYQSSMTDKQKALLPKAAFDVLLNKSATYIFKSDPRMSLSYEEEYKKYKRRYDSLNIQSSFSIEEVVNALTSPRSGFSLRSPSVHQGLWL